MPYANPEQSRTYQRTYKRMKRAGDCQTPCQTLLPADFRLQTATDVLGLVEEQIAEVRSDTEAGKLEKARCVGYLAGIALKAIDAGNVAVRIEAIEVALKQRKPSNGRT